MTLMVLSTLLICAFAYSETAEVFPKPRNRQVRIVNPGYMVFIATTS